MSYQCYQTYDVVPTQTKATILAEWKKEASSARYLWKSAAMAIVEIIDERLACLHVLTCRDHKIQSPSGLPYPQRKRAVRNAIGTRIVKLIITTA